MLFGWQIANGNLSYESNQLREERKQSNKQNKKNKQTTVFEVSKTH